MDPQMTIQSNRYDNYSLYVPFTFFLCSPRPFSLFLTPFPFPFPYPSSPPSFLPFHFYFLFPFPTFSPFSFSIPFSCKAYSRYPRLSTAYNTLYSR